jgi:hypothetical protein
MLRRRALLLGLAAGLGACNFRPLYLAQGADDVPVRTELAAIEIQGLDGRLGYLLRDAMLTPLDWSHALYMPPFSWQVLLRSATAWERLGAILWPAFSGVLIVEATKQIYAVPREPAAERLRPGLRPVPSGALAPRGSAFTAKAGKPPARRTGSAETAATPGRSAGPRR